MNIAGLPILQLWLRYVLFHHQQKLSAWLEKNDSALNMDLRHTNESFFFKTAAWASWSSAVTSQPAGAAWHPS